MLVVEFYDKRGKLLSYNIKIIRWNELVFIILSILLLAQESMGNSCTDFNLIQKVL